tara:strand:- start:40 stop:171 length:132 start_codon:yes stop_codon:yes gene_type:complete
MGLQSLPSGGARRDSIEVWSTAMGVVVAQAAQRALAAEPNFCA